MSTGDFYKERREGWKGREGGGSKERRRDEGRKKGKKGEWGRGGRKEGGKKE